MSNLPELLKRLVGCEDVGEEIRSHVRYLEREIELRGGTIDPEDGSVSWLETASALPPDGRVVVPREPTEAMLEAGHALLPDMLEASAEKIYKAMLAASSPAKETDNGMANAQSVSDLHLRSGDRDSRRMVDAPLVVEVAEPSPSQMDGNRPLPCDRDTLGRLVREAWVRWAQTQPNPSPSWLVAYDDLSEANKEADRQIGEAVARWTLIHDAARASLAEPSPSGEAEAIRRARIAVANGSPTDCARALVRMADQLTLYYTHPAPSVVEVLKEARQTFGELMGMLRKEAPGTPLNNHRFDALGIRAYDALAKIDAALSAHEAGKGAAPSVGDELVKALEKTDGMRHRNDAMGAWIDIHFCNLADQEAFANAIRSALSRTPASGEGR
jgi:hypothetical protein